MIPSPDDQTRSCAPLFQGTLVSHYRIIERIGAGGMGEVYLAEDTKLHRRVALKFLPPQYAADPDFKARLTREAQATAALDHPNIVTVYEVDEFQGRPFFAMQYVEGTPLRDVIEDSPLPISQALRLAEGIAEGLSKAHQAGITHRDIKPSNILVDRDGRPKIVDFGLALTASDERLTRTGSTVGTIGYMSPEQIQGDTVDQRSDLFSFGVVLYQLITGKRPFAGAYEASVMYAIVHETPRPVRSLRSDVPEELERVVTKLLEKDASTRYQNAGEVLDDLRLISGGPTGAIPVIRPRRLTRMLQFALLVVLLGVFFILVWPRIFHAPGGLPPNAKVVAVMPFENLGSPEDEYFADGMTDAITMHLARFGELGVIARTSSMQYKHSEKNLRQIGAELGANYILTGTVQWEKSDSASRVHINAKLVRAADETYLWVQPYERVIDKVFALQSEIAANVTTALNVTLSAADRKTLQIAPTQNLEAYDFFLRGTEYFNRSWERSDIEIAIGFYRRAVELDPKFAAAWAMLSRAEGMMYSEYYDRSAARLEDAKREVNRALELDPNCVEGHLALGYCHYCALDYGGALGEFAVVQGLEPNNHYLYNAIAAVQRRQGNLVEAAQNFTKALDLDPRSYLRAFDVALTYGMMRDWADADTYLDRATMLSPDWPLPYIYRAWLHILRDGNVAKARKVLTDAAGRVDLSRSNFYWWLARIVEPDYEKVLNETAPGPDTIAYYLHCAQMNRLLQRGQIEYAYADSARVLLEGMRARLEGQARFHSQLGLAYAGLRRKAEAIAEAQKAVELLPTSREAFDALFLAVNLTEILVIFDEHDAAVAQLGHLLSIPGFVSIPYLKVDPLWIPLRTNPGFQRLLKGEKPQA